MSDLECPLTLDWLENPITLPCCGKCVSRAPMITHLTYQNICPLCRASLESFDASAAATSVNIQYLVEAAKLQAVPQPLPVAPDPSASWTATITALPPHEFSLDPNMRIAKLQISNPELISKNLIIPVIDLSGSMSGRATVQVIEAAKYIVDATYAHKQLCTSFITYNSRASVLEIDTARPISYYSDIISRFNSGGGTSFRAAFDKILEIVRGQTNSSSSSCSCCSIIFLTDGEDSSVPANARSQLVSALKSEIESIWKHDWVVHTIGFGSSHDSNFLQALRLIGRSEGAYRYAAPSECDDQLFSKIISIVNVLSTSTVTPIEIHCADNNFKIKSGSHGVYWIQGAISDATTVTFQCHSETITLDACVTESEALWSEWYTKLIDDVASELISLTSPDCIAEQDDLAKELHLELLTRRCMAISARLADNSPDAARLENLITTINNIKRGLSVNAMSLLDMKYEGQFSTTVKAREPVVKLSAPVTLSNHANAKPKPVIAPWTTIGTNTSDRLCSDQNCPEIFIQIKKFYNTNSDYYRDAALIEWIEANKSFANDRYRGNTCLHWCSSVGRIDVINYIIAARIVDINAVNDKGFTALDLAICFGFWKSVGVLIKAGGRTAKNSDDLLRTCLTKYYVNTAKCLIINGIATATKELADSTSSTVIYDWLIDNSKHSFTIETAIQKGLIDVVTTKLPATQHINIEQIAGIFTSDTSAHLEIVALLIDSGKFDPSQCFTSNGTTNTALFMAAEKGSTPMVVLLLQHLSTADINWQNSLGTTAVWIACCNRHADVLCELISAGADVNIANNKGDGALIPACQKGSVSIVNILAESGINLHAHNQNRDNAVLICCRTGQATILDMLLQQMPKSILDFYAEIDGFTPLLAATELSKQECMKVCIKYGANLDWRTTETNQIIAGANALHLACFYGRLEAAKVLIAAGSDLKSKTTYSGQTCLHIAVSAGHYQLIAYIIECEPELMNISDNFNRLPIYYATVTGREDIMNAFFIDKLSTIMSGMLTHYTDRHGAILDTYGESHGVFNCRASIDKNLGNGETLYTRALLAGNVQLASKLELLGANAEAPDDYSITPAFWKTMLYGCETSDPTVLNLVSKFNAVKNSSIQNKMLMSTTNIKSECLANFQTVLPKYSLEACMASGFNSQCSASTIKTISNANEASLLSFLDKLAKAKVFPDGIACLNKLLFDAKIHIIKLVASNNGEQLLSPLYQLSLYLYTGNYTVNAQVCTALESFNNKNIWIPYIVCLYKAVRALPTYAFEVYRAVQCTFDPTCYEIGKLVTWNSFSVCTKDWKLTSYQIEAKCGIIFIIKSKSARDVARYAHNPINGEVIFLPRTTFVVSAIYKADVTTLGQANIRTQTYSAADGDIIKASQNKAAIIVELTE